MTTKKSKDSLIEFPCTFDIKVMGTHHPDFLDDIKAITLRLFPKTEERAFRYKKSSQGNYIAITVSVYVKNQTELDALYQEFTQHPHSKMVL